MRARSSLFGVALLLLAATDAGAQETPWYQWTLLPDEVVDEIVGESSGETAWNTIMETGGYNRDRLPEEYAGTFFEARYVHDQLTAYGLPEAEVVRFPGREVWDGIKGELWEVSPNRAKIASYQDMRAMLARGSTSCDVTAELVWVGQGSSAELEAAEVAGKIVVTDGWVSSVHRTACLEMGAVGVVSIRNERPHFDPLQIPWSGIRGDRRSGAEPKFAFYVPPREGASLERRLRAGRKITARAQVESTNQEYDLEDVVCVIPGTDPDAEEIILSAHLFEGYVKQGANDNLSGSAAILEVARVLHALIEEERIPRPKRSIRFLWIPEFSGTIPWVKANRELMAKTLCNLNLDMVGEWLSLNKAFMCLMRTTYGNPHYVNDVVENYYRYVGESNRERVQNRSGFDKVPRRIVAPTGADEPFYYSIETHYGASDHEVFNDWGVGVPGIMMIVWPDQWYHTSGDRVDKSDPTQMKRVVIIAAAAAYTVASADGDLAMRLAGEVASNGTRRLGHQFMMALEKLNHAEAESLADAHEMARTLVDAASKNEVATLETINELAPDDERVRRHVATMQGTVRTVAEAHLAAVDAHARVVAGRLGIAFAEREPTELEMQAARIVPRPTALVTAGGYRAYREHIEAIPEEERAKYASYRRGVASTSELQLLIDGKNSALDIRRMLDAQYRRPSDLQAILDYLEILELAGLIEK